MSVWHVDDLAKEVADMELISQRNRGSELLPRMKEALKFKVDGIGRCLRRQSNSFTPRPNKAANNAPEHEHAFHLPF